MEISPLLLIYSSILHRDRTIYQPNAIGKIGKRRINGKQKRRKKKRQINPSEVVIIIRDHQPTTLNYILHRDFEKRENQIKLTMGRRYSTLERRRRKVAPAVAAVGKWRERDGDGELKTLWKIDIYRVIPLTCFCLGTGYPLTDPNVRVFRRNEIKKDYFSYFYLFIFLKEHLTEY